jgi:hypothetical protein
VFINIPICLNRFKGVMLQLRQLVLSMTAAAACVELFRPSAELHSTRSARSMQKTNVRY